MNICKQIGQNDKLQVCIHLKSRRNQAMTNFGFIESVCGFWKNFQYSHPVLGNICNSLRNFFSQTFYKCDLHANTKIKLNTFFLLLRDACKRNMFSLLLRIHQCLLINLNKWTCVKFQFFVSFVSIYLNSATLIPWRCGAVDIASASGTEDTD
jgi:hypothetical protein